jgi:Zn-dependent metalloprotease
VFDERTRMKPSIDVAVREAFEYSGETLDFLARVFGRNSIDDRGMKLVSTVHYGQDYENAMWNGSQMVYGDGDGKLFNRFTICVDVVGHEITHGMTQFTAKLPYQDQPGALNEHISDVIGMMIKQHRLLLTSDKSDWLIGEGLFGPEVNGKAIRSMAAPGTAYDDPVLGKDPQPAHMRDYVDSPEDNGGVHINSGIPNHAFYQTAIGLGGYSWTVAGPIWYEVAIHRLSARAQFQDCANATVAVAGELYGEGGQVQQIVRDAWAKVGIIVPFTPTKASTARATKQAAAKLWRGRPAIATSH